MTDVLKPTNRLADTTSPYLQQHADNPVDWWPWCPEALALARETNRPILLSIGYSACHWCHVMAHESFEDEGTATLMNRLFVNIKVDREERPDLDKIYQIAHQLLTRRAGGWPLTLFLMPEDHKPFYAGTYFPPEQRHGLPSFTQLLRGIEQAYHEEGDAIRQQNQALMDAMEQMNPSGRSEALGRVPLGLALRQLQDSFDADRGGFGSAPKFPHTTNLELLFRQWAATTGSERPDRQALQMASFTMERMIRGGVSDQLGGGFCRYSVDDDWMIPHFEKMLYDNGPLLALCCDAWSITGATLFHDAGVATADWVMREMQSPEGGYYSTLDADSEGEEGKYYVWDREEIGRLLSPQEYEPFAAVYGLDKPANFEGRWNLHGYRTPQEAASKLGIDEAEVIEQLQSARHKLFEVRELRVRPGRDEKILTAWNALMIKGMARAARVLDRPDYLKSAESALAFVRSTMWLGGSLLATYKDGKAHLNAYLDDHAYLIDALLEMLQVRWCREDLELATALAEVLVDQFRDEERGGFFFTSRGHESLIHRPKPLSDDSVPSGNGIAAQVLQRLGHLLGEQRYLDAAAGTLKLAADQIQQMPYAHASLLMALDEYLDPGETLIIRGEGDGLAHWRQQAQKTFKPRRLVIAIPNAETTLPGALAEKVPGQKIRTYRCLGTQCLPPIEQLEDLLDWKSVLN